MPFSKSSELVAAWLALQRNWWAHDALNDLCRKDPLEAWSVVVELVAAAESDELLEMIGASPLEDLLQDHGSTLLAKVEEEHARSDKFRKALASVWLPRSSDPVTQRLVALGCDLLREQPE